MAAVDGWETPLLVLLQAPSKRAVDELFCMAFRTRLEPTLVPQLAELATSLGVDPRDVPAVGSSLLCRFPARTLPFGSHECAVASVQVLDSARHVVNLALRENMDADAIKAIFPADFHAQLADLIVKVVLHHAGEWRECTVLQQVSLPTLKEMDWRVDIKTASDKLARMAAPTVLVELKVCPLPASFACRSAHTSAQVQENATRVGVMPGVQTVTFELTKETLQTMLVRSIIVSPLLAAVVHSLSSFGLTFGGRGVGWTR